MEQTYSDDEKMLEEPQNTNEGELKYLKQTFDICFDSAPKCFSSLENWITKTGQHIEYLKNKPLKDCIEKYNSDKIAFEEKSKLLTEIDTKLKKSKEKVDNRYKKARSQMKCAKQAIESDSKGFQPFSKSKSETEKNISNINIAIAECNATAKLLNKIKKFKEGFKNTVSSSSESIDKVAKNFGKIISKKNECISEINNYFNSKDKDITRSCSKILKCNANINECVSSVNADCNEISSSNFETNKINKNLIENIDEMIKTNLITLNEICKEADENHLDEFDFKMIQTAFDKVQQNDKKVQEVFKCQTELQKNYEINKSLDKLIDVIQNQKEYIDDAIKNINCKIDSTKQELENNEIEIKENKHFINKEINGSIENIKNAFSKLRKVKKSNFNKVNKIKENAKNLNDSIKCFGDFEIDVLKELHKDCGHNLKLIIEGLQELKQNSEFKEDTDYNNSIPEPVKDLLK